MSGSHTIVPLTAAQRELVQAVLPRVRDQARLFAARWPSLRFEDLNSEGAEAAALVAARYDPKLHPEFEAFAFKRIRGAMIDLARRVLGERARYDVLVAEIHNRDEAGGLGDEELLREVVSAEGPSSVVHTLRGQATVLIAGLLGKAGRGTEEEFVDEHAHRHLLHELRNAVQCLGEPDQTFVRLFYFQDQTLPAIAARLEISPRTVGRIHERVKGYLEALLKQRSPLIRGG